ncbi:FGGY carbohydrate kinase domain-containing protein [Ananas comosus]|uniref:FGGY carbohydrate kinase domain-containing protein n=1 Tax=Ananas comosus TaxID=4615 RepID=A0A199UYK6_ANACO|nr:FGGY carbohydrate kinase domain-containing protein [Ananas comosus]
MLSRARAWSSSSSSSSDTTPLLHRLRSPSAAVEMASAAAAAASSATAAVTRVVFLGVDVGTGSARAGSVIGAGLFDEKGRLLGSASSPIQIWKEKDCIEQSSTDIWHAICAAVKAACSLANVAAQEVVGLGFAATCSLVAVDSDGSPVSVSWSSDARRNIIVWMDHRAVEQAERINSRNSPVLQYCGGGVSPEMQAPKLLWVKENLRESWSMVFRWMDLSDWLAYRATGDDTRSLCTTVCKWTYLGHAHMELARETDSRDMEACGWDDVFWEEIGLEDLVEGNHAKIGRSVAFPGHPLGSGLTHAAAKASDELGLFPGTPVGTSLIDAHAGGIGVMQSVSESESKADAMVPEYWLTEGGQSATGALLEYIVENHVAAPLLANRAASQSISIYELLNKILVSMSHEQNAPFLSALTDDMHVLPDFHGNRSPIADPKSKGMICGLTLDTSEKHLALLYLATIQGIAYGTRHIVEHCNSLGHKIDTLLACGGLAKNSLYIQEHADIVGKMSNHSSKRKRICALRRCNFGCCCCEEVFRPSRRHESTECSRAAMVPEYWLTEGGQSATGALLEYIVENHVAAPLLANRAASQSISIYELLNKILVSMSHEQNAPFLSAVTEDMHVLPDFHGNRSPIADPKSKGMICGLTLDTSEKHLALLYLATIQGIAYGTRHIVEHCNSLGHKIDTLLACVGLRRTRFIFKNMQILLARCPIILPRENESVLLGAAILGAVAVKKYSGLQDAMKALNAAGQIVHPSKDPKVKKYHHAKYKIFRSLYEQQLSHRSIMTQALQ